MVCPAESRVIAEPRQAAGRIRTVNNHHTDDASVRQDTRRSKTCRACADDDNVRLYSSVHGWWSAWAASNIFSTRAPQKNPWQPPNMTRLRLFKAVKDRGGSGEARTSRTSPTVIRSQ